MELAICAIDAPDLRHRRQFVCAVADLSDRSVCPSNEALVSAIDVDRLTVLR
jgi:hypothetical protein